MLSLSEFQAASQQGFTHIPVVCELLADMDTPLSLYVKLANKPYTFLFESVVGGERFGRYSFIGLPSGSFFKVFGQKIEIYEHFQLKETIKDDNPLDFINRFQAAFKTPEIPNLPRFTGGLVGFFGYETVQYIEKRLGKKEQERAIDIPDIMLMLATEIAVVDNLSGKIYLIVYAKSGSGMVLSSFGKLIKKSWTFPVRIFQLSLYLFLVNCILWCIEEKTMLL